MQQTFSKSPLSLIGKLSWDDFIQALQRVPLLGDRSIFPYRDATIESRVARFGEVYPISLYLLRHHLDMQLRLHELFLKQYAIDTLDLDGGHPSLRFRLEGEKEIWHMAPPIVEVSHADGGKPVLLDGEHRFMLARELKRPIRVIWINHIPKEYPPVALPVQWKDVRIFNEVPPESQKRHYRFPKPRHYFYYRDLSAVASSDIRREGSTQ